MIRPHHVYEKSPEAYKRRIILLKRKRAVLEAREKATGQTWIIAKQNIDEEIMACIKRLV